MSERKFDKKLNTVIVLNCCTK